MAVEISMPKLSDTMEEGKILRWLKQVGDRVEPGEVLAEVETDKADMELEASDAGVLTELRAGDGETVSVGAVIAVLDGEARAKSPARSGEPARVAQVSEPEETDLDRAAEKTAEKLQPERQVSRAGQGPSKTAGAAPTKAAPVPAEPVPPRATPLARRVADEKRVDLQEVRGTGAEGRVMRRDVDAAAQGRGAAQSDPREREPATRSPVAAVTPERVEMSKMRQTIARRMAEAKRDVPHFYVTAEIDMGAALELQRSLRRLADDKLTITHVVLKAVARALMTHPRVNGRLVDGAVEIGGAINLGLAVAVDEGLIVPVLHGCESKSLLEIGAEARRLVAQARDGRFSGDDLKGGTFSVSNLGMLDVDEFAAIINPPQAAILAVGATKERPVVRNGQLAVGQTMRVTLSCDHRQLNGVEAGRFLETLKELLETPAALLLA